MSFGSHPFGSRNQCCDINSVHLQKSLFPRLKKKDSSEKEFISLLFPYYCFLLYICRRLCWVYSSREIKAEEGEGRLFIPQSIDAMMQNIWVATAHKGYDKYHIKVCGGQCTLLLINSLTCLLLGWGCVLVNNETSQSQWVLEQIVLGELSL